MNRQMIETIEVELCSVNTGKLGSDESIHSAIRTAVRWYNAHTGGRPLAVLITDDAENLKRALAEGLAACTGITFSGPRDKINIRC